LERAMFAAFGASTAFLGFALLASATRLCAATLPARIAPQAPFPLVIAQSSSDAFVAPGVVLARYNLATNAGPLVVCALSIDLREPMLRLGAVLANDRLISGGETVSAMARRTHAVAGVNADYFDIGATNQPLNIVVRDGALVRTPSGRAAMTVTRDRHVRFETYRFSGTVTDADRSWPLGAVDEWPPQATGASLMLPAFGPPPERAGVTIAALEPKGPLAGSLSGAYRVTSVSDASSAHARGVALAFAPGAASAGALPVTGDVVRVDASTDPPLDDVLFALGGGPLLLQGGAPYADPDPPSPGEALHHDPQVGALRRDDDGLVFVEVDGRMPDYSAGLTRPEFGALLRAFGAVDAIAFDSGGSATIVARSPGDAQATVQNVPSDGAERPVADGFFIYSDAPLGPPARLVVRPAPIVLLAGAIAAPTAVVTDAAGHPLASNRATRFVSVEPATLARIEPAVVLGLAPGSGTLRVARGSLSAEVPVRVVGRLARLRIEPAHANPDPGGVVAYRAVGTDAAGAPVEVTGRVRWSATHGTVEGDGRLHAGTADAQVTAFAGGAEASVVALVGRREIALPLLFPPIPWTFSTVPAGGNGSVTVASGQLNLTYDLSAPVRAAYAGTSVDLLGTPLAFSVEVRAGAGGSGAEAPNTGDVSVRAAFLNAQGQRVAVTVARRVDWAGWQRRVVTLPANARAPLQLRSLYVVGAGAQPARGRGVISFRDARVTFAGTSTPDPPFATSRTRERSSA
jgi:phosphodiester glycosidase